MSWEWALQENQAEVAWLCLLPSGLQSHKITSTVFYQPRQPPLTPQIQEKRNPAAISAWKDINSFAGSTCLVAMPTGCAGQTERKLPTVFLYKGIGIQGGPLKSFSQLSQGTDLEVGPQPKRFPQ